jgi:GDP-mannose 6-dehydrogenase
MAQESHDVTGVDINPSKVATLNAGRSPIIEPGLAPLIAEGVKSGRLRATTDAYAAVEDSDVSFICVGTPSSEAGALDMQFVARVCAEIGGALRQRWTHHTVVIRSTMLPGSTEQVAVPILERASGKRAGIDFGVTYNPEFLREGTAISDFHDPPRIVIGELNRDSGDVVEQIYANAAAPRVRTGLREAEMIKYADNAFHGLKVAFANEIGNLCKALGVNGQEAMEIFVLDTKLNLSPSYLRPGYAFGGSCLPKGLRALIHAGGRADVGTPLLRAILESNEMQKLRGIEMIRRTGLKKIGMLGLSFKQGTDDLRESPAVELAETLLGKGYDVAIYDPDVSMSRLVGSNRTYIERELPHLSTLMRPTLEETVEHAEVVVIANHNDEFTHALSSLRPNQFVLDLVGVSLTEASVNGQYEGISW